MIRSRTAASVATAGVVALVFPSARARSWSRPPAAAAPVVLLPAVYTLYAFALGVPSYVTSREWRLRASGRPVAV